MVGVIMLNRIVLISLLFFYNIVLAETLPVLSGVGGNFSAIANGKEIEFSHFKGKVVVLSFGYTNCADICPLTLGYYKRLYNELSAEEQQATKMLFITVDPEYDTSTHLTEFVSHFNKDFIGMTGTRAQIDTIVSLFKAEYNKLSVEAVDTDEIIRRVIQKKIPDNVSKDTAYVYSHTVSLYLIDKDGDTRALLYTGTPIAEFADKIRILINE
jgi:protein SCO1/2